MMNIIVIHLNGFRKKYKSYWVLCLPLVTIVRCSNTDFLVNILASCHLNAKVVKVYKNSVLLNALTSLAFFHDKAYNLWLRLN